MTNHVPIFVKLMRFMIGATKIMRPPDPEHTILAIKDDMVGVEEKGKKEGGEGDERRGLGEDENETKKKNLMSLSLSLVLSVKKYAAFRSSPHEIHRGFKTLPLSP